MFLIDGTTHLVTSASDLNLASSCEFAFLRTLDKRLGWITDDLPKNEDPMFARAVTLGNSHERRLLERYRDEHGDAMVELPDERSKVPEVLRQRAAIAAEAMRAGAPVVFQGVFFDETDAELPFVGYADFLVRQPDGRYRVVDTKLSRHVKVTALLQLAAYHEQLLKLGIPADDTVELVLGDDRPERAHIDEIAPVFRRRRAHLHALIAQHRAGGEPVRWGDDRYTIDGRCEFCEGPAAEADDLITVAGMRLTQRTKLRAAGIRTLTELAGSTVRPDGCDIPSPTYTKLQQQAALQATARGDDPHAVPPFVVTDPRPIAGLPAPSAGDLFFDFEGDPMYSETRGGTPRWGLDYLFGWVDARGDFDCLWAHSHQEERDALLRFLEFVTQRRAQHPDLHIYHYASYEKTHLLSIAARHGVGERAVDDLLREGVLVDLYPVVKKSLLVGAPSYSIKKLEPLYMGDEQREGVANAADSVEQYVAFTRARDGGDSAQAQRLLDDIAQYNAYDCRSTLALRDWLRALPGVQSAPGGPAAFEGTAFEPSPLDLQLQQLAEQASDRGDADAAGAYRMAAAAIDFHRRENKSFWWEHYDRLEQPPELWEATRGVFVVERADVERDWHLETQRQKNPRRWVRLHGQWAPGSGAPRKQETLFARYDDPLPYLPPGHRPGFALAHEVTLYDDQRDDGSILIVETRQPETEAWQVTPGHLTPGPPPPTKSLVTAIEAWGATIRDAAPHWPDDAMTSLLLRRPPATELEPMRDADDGVRAVVASLTGMKRGYLAVQGPPGTGKTYLAAHVIRDLIEHHHWRVGVTAQSHKVVEHVLDAIVVDAGVPGALVGKAPSREQGVGYYGASPFTEIGKERHLDFDAAHADTGYAMGGTAWDLTNRGRVAADQLDLLVIDEAGQFSLANTIAVATSAKRILLLGDPQQLPQVSQGIHPAPVDGSALGHVIGGDAVLPEQFGYFLAESRRMVSAVTGPVSHLSYEGRLRSHPATAARELVGVAPGLHAVPVAHDGNSTCSPEEAAVVVDLVRDHLGAAWSSAGEDRPLGQPDVIVVTPYNAQVATVREHLDAAGFTDVPVGTVDRFQGREAVIAIVSLAASSADDVPRGIDFLLSRNRLNVSISRAKWAAYLVHSPGLLDGLPTTPEAVAALSRFITLVEDAGEPRRSHGHLAPSDRPRTAAIMTR